MLFIVKLKLSKPYFLNQLAVLHFVYAPLVCSINTDVWGSEHLISVETLNQNFTPFYISTFAQKLRNNVNIWTK